MHRAGATLLAWAALAAALVVLAVPRSSALAAASPANPSNTGVDRDITISASWQWLEEAFSRELNLFATDPPGAPGNTNKNYYCAERTPDCMGTGQHPRCRPLSVHVAPTEAELKLPPGSKVLAFGHSFLSNAFTTVVSVANREPFVAPLTQQAAAQRRLRRGEVVFTSTSGMCTTPPPPPPSRPACPEVDDYFRHGCTRNESKPGVAAVRYAPYSDAFGIRMANAGAPDPDACGGEELASLGLSQPRRPSWEHFDQQNATLVSIKNVPLLQSGEDGCLENLRQFLEAEEGGFDAVVFMRPHKTAFFKHQAHKHLHPGVKLRAGMPGWVDLSSRHDDDDGGAMSSKSLAALFATAAPTVIEMLPWTRPSKTPEASKCTLREHVITHGNTARTTSRSVQASLRHNRSFVIDLDSCMGGGRVVRASCSR